MGTALGCPRFSLLESWKIPSATLSLSGNLAHELFSSPRPRCNLCSTRRTYPLLRVRGAGRPHCGSRHYSDGDQLFILRWRELRLFRHGFLPCSPLFQSPRILPSQLVGISSHFLSSSSSSVDLAPTQAKLGSFKLGHAGQVVARGSSPAVSMVGPAWPRNEHTGLLPVVRFSDGELLSDLDARLATQWQDFRGVSYSSVGGLL